MRKTHFIITALLLATLTAFSQTTAEYYAAARGKSGSALKTALFNIISPHTNVGYDGLFTVYIDSDLRPDGKIWDMYSDMTNFAIGDHSSYHEEGDCYNREHSVPQSWFNKANPMKSDAFHVIPVDGYVNNRRSNYPYGETTKPSYSSSGGFSKLGPCSVSGYTGTVFEPNDMYKGDIARIYFYMVTCYEDRVTGWSSAAIGSSKYMGLSDWTMRMMLQWAQDDPVSQKEITPSPLRCCAGLPVTARATTAFSAPRFLGCISRKSCPATRSPSIRPGKSCARTLPILPGAGASA